jgi:polyhydroxybutyrate depolymerase
MSWPTVPLNAGEHQRTLECGGRTRKFLIHIPRKADSGGPLPLVLAFHGAGSNARYMVDFSGLSEKADEAGFIVVYPDGTGRAAGMHTWNAGHCCGHAERNQVDDVGFVRALLDELFRLAPIDRNRVYAAGMSNGGMMCYRLADEMAERFAAIASVGGPMGSTECHPSRPVPVIHFHGTNDLFAPFEGGFGERSISRIDFFSIPHTIATWAKANGCPRDAVVAQLPTSTDDGTRVTRSVYGPGTDGSEVVLYTIEGAGHTWPGRQPSLAFLGSSTVQIVANDLIWEFFSAHSQTG